MESSRIFFHSLDFRNFSNFTHNPEYGVFEKSNLFGDFRYANSISSLNNLVSSQSSEYFKAPFLNSSSEMGFISFFSAIWILNFSDIIFSILFVFGQKSPSIFPTSSGLKFKYFIQYI
jgi:hypothetical protein